MTDRLGRTQALKSNDSRLTLQIPESSIINVASGWQIRHRKSGTDVRKIKIKTKIKKKKFDQYLWL